MQIFKKIFPIVIIIMIICSCNRTRRLKLIEPEHTFNQYGRVENKPLPGGKKKVVSYWDIRSVDFILMHTPKGKIDDLMKRNPDWAFLFYIKCNIVDTLKVINTLNRYNQNFEVILDFNSDFVRKNNLDPNLASNGFICDSENSVLGTSVIGTTMSFFDSEFDKVKKILR